MRRVALSLLVALAVGGCSFAGSLQLGDVTLGLSQGFHAFGSRVAFVLH
jgi:hypothetical protein